MKSGEIRWGKSSGIRMVRVKPGTPDPPETVIVKDWPRRLGSKPKV
ncbi:MAG: hypothetical protein ACREJQ_08910 [bacterium]